jgi:hypothetical protein
MTEHAEIEERKQDVAAQSVPEKKKLIKLMFLSKKLRGM